MNHIERLSFRNRHWNIKDISKDALSDMLLASGNPVVAPILASRGFSREEAAAYLDPAVKKSMPDPMHFKDMKEAVVRIAKAAKYKQRVAIWTDYDVDGATSGAIMGRFLKALGIEDVMIRVPDRITEGYGPNADGIREIHEAGYDLLMVLDAGTVAFEPLGVARELNMDVIVIDHHAAEDSLPPALALINPNRKDETGDFGHVCAAGMCFITVIAATMVMARENFFEKIGIPPIKASDYIDLAALGTVADVVPLRGLNRAIVASGLKALSLRQKPGIRALAELAGIEGDISASNVGFGLGPRINAGGRIGKADAGTRLLLTDVEEEALEIAKELQELNTKRQLMEKKATAEALDGLQGRFFPGETRKIAICLVDAHEGIVGITASRVKDQMDAPSLVLTEVEDGILKGSARSVGGFDIGAAIIAARQAGILLKGGGHGMAGGLTIEKTRLPEFEAFINARIDASEYAMSGVSQDVDIVIQPGYLKTSMIHDMLRMAPFGTGNPRPRVMLPDMYLAEVKIMKDIHIKLRLTSREKVTVDALIWNAVPTPFGEKLMKAEKQPIDVVGTLELNNYAGKTTIQMMLEDARYPNAIHSRGASEPHLSSLFATNVN